MALRLADLLADESLRLRLRAGDLAQARDITWVHVIDVPDPARWLDGGELVLTTGLGLVGRGAAELHGYVVQLVDRGIAALGFGTGVTVDDVPTALLEAADESGLPLFEVPIDVPFVAVTRAVADRLAAQRYHRVEQAVDTQQRITRAAVGKGAPGVLATLMRHVPGWGLVTDPGGRVLACAPDPAAEAGRSAQVRAAIAGRAAGPLGLVVEVPDGLLAVQSLGAGPHPRGYLAVCSPTQLTDPERLVVNHAASLVSLELEKSDALRRIERRLHAALLSALMDGWLGGAQAEDQLAAIGFPADAPATVLLLTTSPDAADGVADRVRSAWPDDGRPVAVAARRDGVVVLLGDEDAGALAAAERTLAALPDLPVRGVGGSEPTSAREIRTALRMAASAAAVSASDADSRAAGSALSRAAGVQRRPALVRFADLPVMSVLLRTSSPDGLRTVVDSMLGPLRDYDEGADGDLVRSLRAFLAANARWEDAAAELQVHRHTLRYRMTKVEALTGRSLSSARHRAEFWFALEAAALLGPAVAGPGAVARAPEWNGGPAEIGQVQYR